MKILKSAGSIFNSVLKWTTAALIIFIFLNIISYLVLPLLPSRERDLATSIADDPGSIDKSLYTEMGDDYAIDVLTDLISYFQKGLSYFPHSEYCETPFRSKTLNIVTDPTGFTYRRGFSHCFINPDSSKKRIYVFGGSTTMGIFSGDKETWTAQLSKLLNSTGGNTEVVNYAVSGHSITEEYLRFYDLIKAGHRPSMVVVMDGLNLGLETDQSKFSNVFFKKIKQIQQGESAKSYFRNLVMKLPLTKLLIQVSPAGVLKYFFIKQVSAEVSNSPLEFYSDRKVVHYQTNRFNTGIADFKSLCSKYDIGFLYCLQPNAFYNYAPDSCSACTKIANPNYKSDADTIYSSIKTQHPDVVDLNGLFAKYGKRAIVDDTHYSPAFNSFIAAEVATHIPADSLRIAYIDHYSATGAPYTFFGPAGK